MLIPKLNPYAFHIGPVGVHWYGIFMVLAILGGAWYLVERGREVGQDPDQLANITFWTVIAGVIGARLVFVLANDPNWIWTDPVQALKIWDGGLAYDGAVGAGVLALWYQLRKEPLTFNRLVDWMVPGIGLGIFMVRIGNIFNHEVLGRMTELGFGRWPEQLWGSSIGVILIVRYFWIQRHRTPPPGYQFWSAMFYYALLRGLIGETTRGNPLYLVHYINPYWGIGFLTLMQIFTPPIVIFTGWMMRRTWRRSAVLLNPTTPVETGSAASKPGWFPQS
jgi:phosphatidylglycerol:prolipoprotein diacylglycerol transferase